MCNLRIRTVYPLSLLPNLLLRLLMDSGLKPGRDPSPNNCSDGGLRRQKTRTLTSQTPSTNGNNRPCPALAGCGKKPRCASWFCILLPTTKRPVGHRGRLCSASARFCGQVSRWDPRRPCTRGLGGASQRLLSVWGGFCPRNGTTQQAAVGS